MDGPCCPRTTSSALPSVWTSRCRTPPRIAAPDGARGRPPVGARLADPAGPAAGSGAGTAPVKRNSDARQSITVRRDVPVDVSRARPPDMGQQPGNPGPPPENWCSSPPSDTVTRAKAPESRAFARRVRPLKSPAAPALGFGPHGLSTGEAPAREAASGLAGDETVAAFARTAADLPPETALLIWVADGRVRVLWSAVERS